MWTIAYFRKYPLTSSTFYVILVLYIELIVKTSVFLSCKAMLFVVHGCHCIDGGIGCQGLFSIRRKIILYCTGVYLQFPLIEPLHVEQCTRSKAKLQTCLWQWVWILVSCGWEVVADVTIDGRKPAEVPRQTGNGKARMIEVTLYLPTELWNPMVVVGGRCQSGLNDWRRAT